MNCEQIQPNLLDYSRGQLSRPESEKVRLHIAKCDQCAALLEDEAAFAGRLGTLPYEQAANDVWALVRARTKPSRFRSVLLPDKLTTRFGRIAATTVAAAAILATAYSLKTPAPPTQPDNTRPISVAVVSDDPLGGHSDAMIDVIDNM
ncbi:MAG: zf-HC2 domain-containing protein [Armatimonadetes bacterium]|nr:zf-HC2 domain-containing protein [Armatimonadota bacterium]